MRTVLYDAFSLLRTLRRRFDLATVLSTARCSRFNFA
jgi:hypothetical protein